MHVNTKNDGLMKAIYKLKMENMNLDGYALLKKIMLKDCSHERFVN